MERFPTDAQPASRADRSRATLLNMTANFASPDYSTMGCRDLLALLQWTQAEAAAAAHLSADTIFVWCARGAAPATNTLGRMLAATAARCRALRIQPPSAPHLAAIIRRGARRPRIRRDAAMTTTPTGAASQS